MSEVRAWAFHPGSRHAGYLVFFRPVAVFHSGVAGADGGFEIFLSHGRAGYGIRYHLFLGYQDDFFRL